MQSELVSVVIPTRNRKELLTYALRSVLQQTHRRLQVIIHDNHSTDGTPEMIAPFLEDERVEYHRSERDLSMTENWNTAMRYVHGQYVVRLDDDNIFSPRIVSSALADIRRFRLHAVLFANLIVTPGEQLRTCFDHEDAPVILLSKYQWMYLEYFALSDSNYTFYSTALLRSIFPDGDVYRTSLPDRFLHYRCMDAMDRLALRIGFDLSVNGVTRFDNQRPGSAFVNMVDYSTVDFDRVMEGDCHHNYSMHRVLTVRRALDIASDRALADFYFRRITADRLCTTVMRMGHVVKNAPTWTWREVLVYERLIIRVVADLLCSPTARIEGRIAVVEVAAVLKRVLVFFSTLLMQRNDGAIPTMDLRFGNSVVERVLGGYTFSSEEAPSRYGNIHEFFRRVALPTKECRENAGG